MPPKKTSAPAGANLRKGARKGHHIPLISAREQSNNKISPSRKRTQQHHCFPMESNLVPSNVADDMNIMESLAPFTVDQQHAGDYAHNEYISGFTGPGNSFNEMSFPRHQNYTHSSSKIEPVGPIFTPTHNLNSMEVAFMDNYISHPCPLNSTPDSMWQTPLEYGFSGDTNPEFYWFPTNADTSLPAVPFSNFDQRQESVPSGNVPQLTFDHSSPEEDVEFCNNEELVGVGLYEDESMSSFRPAGSEQSKSHRHLSSSAGKGLVLEKTWQPPAHLISERAQGLNTGARDALLSTNPFTENHATSSNGREECGHLMECLEMDAEGDFDTEFLGPPSWGCITDSGHPFEPFADFPLEDVEIYNHGEYGQ